LADAQETYSELRQKALETMHKAKDLDGYRLSLSFYEDAFKKFPDSVEMRGLSKASSLASELKEFDKAFSFLNQLVETDESAEVFLPGWNSITGKYAESEYKNLLNDPRWKIVKEKALFKKKSFFQKLKDDEDEFFSIKQNAVSSSFGTKKLYEELKSYNPYLTKKKQDYSISFQINDSTKTAFLVHLPKNYNPEKKYPLHFFLHGAVRNNALVDFQPVGLNLGEWNRYYTKYAEQNDVILVFPKGSRQYNWMTPDDGFFMIPEMLKLIKKGINVDDNKIFISGHSNGATGSFSYLMKQPSQFAGFYGFNTYPKVFTGGTFVENIKNRSFINFSTDQDYYYPPNANDDFTKLMNKINADYEEYRYNGFPHWFPQFDESEPAYKILFDDLVNRKRNPFPKEISWEFDDDKANWHKKLNFKITQWLDYDKKDSLIVQEVDKNAFDFPRKSGKIKAEYNNNNVFNVETSNIQSFAINISPEMVNLKKKVKVYVNGKLYFYEMVKYNREFMLQNFENNRDREQIWISSIYLKTF